MFALQPKATFKAEISIPVPGGAAGKINFEFKRLGKKAIRALFDSLQKEGVDREDADVLSEIVAGWSGVDTEFSQEALATLADAYPGAVTAIIVGYNKEMIEGRTKN